MCKVPHSLKKYRDKFGGIKLPPYTLSPFRVQDNGHLSFQTQLYFFDFQKNNSTLVFLNGHEIQKKKEVDEKKNPRENGQIRKMLPPQWPSFTNEDFIVMHPILAYKSCAPTDNELIFVNLVQNVP